ncbi:hypothetical protein OAF27_02730, partial [Verrucomicrobiales bacterium]|nr:hypothetical protein [Verrucomicrobiales bacterium]
MKPFSALTILLFATQAAAQDSVILWNDRSNGGTFSCTEGGLSRNFRNNDFWSQSFETSEDDPLCDPYTLPSNWSTPTFPSGSDLTVSLGYLEGGQGTNTILDVFAVSLGTLLVGEQNILSMARISTEPTTLTINDAIINDGTIAPGDGFSDIVIASDMTLQGSGKVLLEVGQNRILSAAPENRLTVGPDQEISATLPPFGFSKISALLTNNGTISGTGGTPTASGGILTLDELPKTNNALIQAAGRGTVIIDGITIENASGTIASQGPDSTISLTNATINGGTLTGPGSTTVATGHSTLNGPIDLTGGFSLDMVGTTT